MGHLRLGRLPKTHRWKQVVALLEEGAELSSIVQASLHAADAGLRQIPNDPGFCSVLTNVFQFVDAVRSEEVTQALWEKGYKVESKASVLDYLSSLGTKIDRDLSHKFIRSDVSEICQDAFTETLLNRTTANLPSLFESSSEQVHKSLKQSLSGKNFSGLMHDFFTTFTHRYLQYYLSRELPRHIGSGGYFDNLESHVIFNDALNLFVRQSVRIADLYLLFHSHKS